MVGLNFENLRKNLERHLSESLRNLGKYGPVLTILVATLSVSFIHLSAFILMVPIGLRPVVDLGTATTFSMVVFAHAIIAAVLARVIAGSISIIWWMGQLGIYNAVSIGSLYAVPRFIEKIVTRKARLDDVWDELQLRPILIDAALTLGKAGSFKNNSWNRIVFTTFLTLALFFWSYLGFGLAIRAMFFVFLIIVALFFPLFALQFYNTAKEFAQIEKLPEFGDVEVQVDDQVLEARETAHSFNNYVYLVLVVVLSSSAISGALRLPHLQENSRVLIDEGSWSRIGSLIVSNSQGFLFWDPVMERHRFVTYGSHVSVCEIPKRMSHLNKGCTLSSPEAR